jgi:hypothetical protein
MNTPLINTPLMGVFLMGALQPAMTLNVLPQDSHYRAIVSNICMPKDMLIKSGFQSGEEYGRDRGAEGQGIKSTLS